MKANINNKNVAKMESKCTEWTKQLITWQYNQAKAAVPCYSEMALEKSCGV
jgi:hypothetical protein